MDTPAKSVSTLKGDRLANAWATDAKGKDKLCIKIVWPSGGALAIMSAPMDPPAPARLSTVTGCPMDSLIFWATKRATISVVPPAGNGTIILMGLEG